MLISAGELVKASWNLYKKNFRTFIIYSLMLVLPMLAAVTIAGGAIAAAVGLNIKPEGEAALFGGVAGLIAVFVLAMLVSFWFSLAVIRVIGKSYENIPLKSIREELGDAAPLMWPGILATLLGGLAILGGYILLIVPGIIFSLWFAFVLQTVSLDNIRGIEALRASKKLVSGRWWTVLWRLLVPTFIALIISWGITLPLDISADITDSGALYGASAIVSALLSILIAPFITGTQIILYLELKKHPVALEEPTPHQQTPQEPPV